MKKLYLIVTAVLLINSAFAQSSAPNISMKFAPLDKSPLDIIYYPNNYPVLRIQDRVSEPVVARLIYSRPQKDHRTIFGDIVEYNAVWRLGANEATELELFRDVKVQDKKLPKGRYTMYAIPQTSNWTIIFNKDTDIWGAFGYDEKKDVLRVTVPVQKNATPAEAFSAVFNKSAVGTDLVLAWDDVSVSIPFNLK